jgi:hypothetical protein
MKQAQKFYSPNGDNSNADGGSDKKTDNTKLVATDTVYVSPDGGTTNEAFPAQGVEYDFCVDVSNTADLPSGPFYVHFTLSGDQNPPFEQDFKQDAGLDAGQSVKAVVHFGSFPNEFKDYLLEACIFSPSAPEKSINCAGTFDFPVNTEDSGTSSSGNEDNTGSSSDSSDPSTDDPDVSAVNAATSSGSASADDASA